MSFGAGMLRQLKAAKKDEAKATAVNDLEESRKRNALQMAEARAQREREAEEKKALAAQIDEAEDREAWAIVQKLKAAERYDAEKLRRDTEARERLDALIAAKDLTAASRWHYMDASGKKQGPFYPKQMREWFCGGFLPRTLLVAPCFGEDGRIPRIEEMRPICACFREPLATHAFRSAAGVDIAAPPPPPPPTKEGANKKRDREDKPGNWLNESIARQKSGIHRLRHDRHDGPGMVFDQDAA